MITIEDVAYIRVAVDDLEAQERFLLDFGMHRVHRSDRALYMRGAGTQPVIHISELRTDDYRPGIGLIAASPADLEKVAQTLGTAVFAGMIVATCIGVFLIPMLYVVFQTFRERAKQYFARPAKSTPAAARRSEPAALARPSETSD